jgi:hypothetical protein
MSNRRIESYKLLPGRDRRVKKGVTKPRPQPREGHPVTAAAVREYIQTLQPRYAVASRAAKQQILTEFCATTAYHR